MQLLPYVLIFKDGTWVNRPCYKNNGETSSISDELPSSFSRIKNYKT